MRKGGGKSKGSAFERRICKELSRWWSGGKSDDIFYRTASSGGRATSRSKRGKKTFGQYGDVQACDPVGQTLIDAVTIELKKGYSKDTLMDLLDRKKLKPGLSQYEKFILQVINDSQFAGTPAWMLIIERNSKEAVVLFPMRLYKRIKGASGELDRCIPKAVLHLHSFESEIAGTDNAYIFCTTLREFFWHVSPNSFIQHMRN